MKVDVYRVVRLREENIKCTSIAIFQNYKEFFVTEENVSDSEQDMMCTVTSTVEAENKLGGRETIEYTINLYGDASKNEWYAELVDMQ